MLDICLKNEIKQYQNKIVISNKELPCFQIMPNDDFTFDIFFDLIEIYIHSYYSYYICIYFIYYSVLILYKIILSFRSLLNMH